MAEVLTLAEIKEYLRIDGEEEDTLLTALYAAAKEHCENYLQAPLPSEMPMPVKQALLILILALLFALFGVYVGNLIKVYTCETKEFCFCADKSGHSRRPRFLFY